jgi:3'-5' exoribonuclease
MTINDLRAGEPVDGEFLVKEKSLREFKNKPGRYLSLTLADETGKTIEARLWDKAESLAAGFEAGEIVLARGQVEAFQDKLQIKLTAVIKSPKGGVERFIPALPASRIEELAAEFKQRITTIKDPHLRALLEKIFGDKATWEKFCQATAARRLHSAYVGGLLEHTMNVATLCEAVCPLYPEINRDLLIAAALLHDIGKLDSYEARGAIFEYTDAFGLIGEPVLGEKRLSEAVAGMPNFPANYHLLLSHLILSHHGVLEFGAPVVPASLEAMILHHVDDLEAKTNAVISIMHKEQAEGKVWSEHDRALARRIFLTRLETENLED